MATEAVDDFFDFYWAEVEVGFGARVPQNRLSVALRPVLALPHLLVLVVLAAVSVLLAIAGWFAALKLGRLPRPIADYQMRWIAYSARVSAYVFFVLDDYPPFSLTAVDYPVKVDIRASRLSGLAVFFRFVLLIPAFVVWVVSLTGLVLFSPIIWISTLINGKMPEDFFGSAAAVIRYQTRFVAYAVMVTGEYPQRLFGDHESSESELPLRLPSNTKSLLIVIVIFGAIGSSVGAFWLVLPGNPSAAALKRLDDATAVFKRATSRCPAGPERFRCYERAESTWSTAWQRYGSDIAGGLYLLDRKGRGEAAIGASTEVWIALFEASRAKTESAHQVAYERVLKLVMRFDAIAAGVR